MTDISYVLKSSVSLNREKNVTINLIDYRTMPAVSKAQQKLFSMAVAVRKGDLTKTEVGKSVLDIVNGDMTDSEIKDFTILKECNITEFLYNSLQE